MHWSELEESGYLSFTLECIQQQQLPVAIMEAPFSEIISFPIGHHLLVKSPEKILYHFDHFVQTLESNIIYHIQDEYLCSFFCLQIPNCDTKTILFVGPYLLDEVTKKEKYSVLTKNGLTESILPQLDSYFTSLTKLHSEEPLRSLLSVLGKKLWGSFEHFSIQEKKNYYNPMELTKSVQETKLDYQDSIFFMESLRQRYDLENELLNAVSKGFTHQAEMALHRFVIASRMDAIQHPHAQYAQNNMIILNAFLRKAAEKGYVHPLHIDQLSSQLTKRIEESYQKFSSKQFTEAFAKEMIRKYTLLVKSHSLREYSDLIRQALTMITADLTADLNLNAIAKALNINASYLSTTFKKELGITLTDYVTQKRVEHAIFLLNSSHLPISEIAQFCGIPDVQYFSKIFKKQIGQSPSEYRKMLQPNKKNETA